jgi:hypothetical protein
LLVVVGVGEIALLPTLKRQAVAEVVEVVLLLGGFLRLQFLGQLRLLEARAGRADPDQAPRV